MALMTDLPNILILLLFAALVAALSRWRTLKTNLRRERKKSTEVLAELEDLRQTMDQQKEKHSEIIHRSVHDLRTPLNNIIGFADILLSGMEGELAEPQRKDMEIILDSARVLTRQVNDLLEMDTIESETIQLNRTHLSPEHALHEAVEELQKEIKEKGITVTVAVPDPLPSFHADAQRLQQVLSHLLGDTLHFLQRGEILFRAECNDQNGHPQSASSPEEKVFLRIIMTVHHTGMEEQHLDTFYRLRLPSDATGRTAPGGSSLSIMIAQRLIHLMGGKIGLEYQEDRVRGLRLTLPSVKDPQ